MNKPNSKYFGHFNDTSNVRAHDPGMQADCLICNRMLAVPVKTISLMLDGDDKSYFFRTHKDCWEGLSADEQAAYEHSLIDGVAAAK